MPDLRSFLDAIPVPVFSYDRAGRHTFVNVATCRLVGLPADQILGRTIADLGFPPHLGLDFATAVQRVAETCAPHAQRLVVPTPAGDVVLEVRLSCRPDLTDGHVREVIGVGTDITAQARAEEELRRSEARYRQVVQDQTEVVCRFLADGRFTFVNDVYCRVFGKSAGELIGNTWQPLVHPDDVPAVRAALQQMAAHNPVVRVENRVTYSDGQVRWMEFVNRGFYSPEGVLLEVQAVGRDVTERLAAEEAARAEAERSKFERQLLQSQKLESLGVLAGGIAHDFNNLLTVILGNASLARMNNADGMTAETELEQIEKAAHRAAELCQQMLAYAGRGQFHIKAIDLGGLVREMAELLASSISKKAVLRFHLAPGVPTVTGDPTQIRQVVMNLITNASDAIGATSGVVTLATGAIDADEKYLAEISLASVLKPGRYLYLEVSDTGTGMPDDVKARIFEPFFTTKFTGRGLGLAAVQGIVRAHKGAIKVYSQPGRGTTFKVLFPADGPAPSAAPPPPAPPRRNGRGRLVLVVDDEEDVRVTARKMLEHRGFVVEVASNGIEGVEVFSQRPDDYVLALLDLTMPRMGGVEAFRELRRIRPDVRVILMSGFAAAEATAGFEGKGLAGFISKPFPVEELLATVFDAVGP